MDVHRIPILSGEVLKLNLFINEMHKKDGKKEWQHFTYN